MTHSGGLAQPEARAAGHLLAVLDERDNSTLVRAVCELAAADRYASEPGEVRYDRVLAWVVERIAEIIIEPLEWGPQEPAAYKVASALSTAMPSISPKPHLRSSTLSGQWQQNLTTATP